MENRLSRLFVMKKSRILNVYFTAGYPTLDSTVGIIKSLEKAGADIIELGIPYSDPLADGPTIQNSSAAALNNGMHLDLVFEQVLRARKESQIPIVLMGYFNQMLQYGERRFISRCKEVGVDGLILPDLPMYIYERDYRSLFEECGISISFLITPETSESRIKKADSLSSGFLYVVSQSSITGKAQDTTAHQIKYFDRIKNMDLYSPKLIGFGIHDRASFDLANEYAEGAIIGSAFIRMLGKKGAEEANIKEFVNGIISPV